MNKFIIQLKNQFFGRVFWGVFFTIAVTYAVSWMVFQTFAAPVALALAGACIFALSIWRLHWGVLAAFAELFANSHGHLISATMFGQSVSLRMVIFAAVMSAWGVLFVMQNTSVNWRDARLSAFLPLVLAVVLGFFIGGMENGVGAAFRDGNAYLYLCYLLPILSIDWNAQRQRELLQTLSAGAVWVCVLTLALLYLYSHYPEPILEEVYTFFRDTRTAEITPMGAGIYRVFLQAQMSVIFAIFILFGSWWFAASTRQSAKLLLPVLGGLVATLLISMSRSFWVGAFCGAVVFVVGAWHGIKEKRKLFYNIGYTALTKIVALLMLLSVVLFPFPQQRGSADSLSQVISARATATSDAAVDSRWQLLSPMIEAAKNRPVTGYGFGKEVTFVTDDPRIRSVSPDGVWSTDAFEWGWLDIWLKMGVLGVVAFGWLALFFGKQILREYDGERKWLGIAFASMIVTVFATHMFSPYLNHPIGLGALLFIVPFLSPHKTDRAAESSILQAESGRSVITSNAVASSQS